MPGSCLGRTKRPGQAPELITATESQLTEYRAAELVAPLNDYANSARHGFSAADLADFYPAYLTANQNDGQLLALPFAKSVLALYYNDDKLREIGVSVPETWDDFAATCKRFTGDVKGYAIGISASTFTAMVYSRGGRMLDDGQATWRFNEQPGQDQLALLQELVASGCAYLVDKQYADQGDFGAGRAVFTIDASSGFSYYRDLVAGGGRFNWGVAALPHAPGTAPATTLSGSNLTILRSTPERQLATWLFIKYACPGRLLHPARFPGTSVARVPESDLGRSKRPTQDRAGPPRGLSPGSWPSSRRRRRGSPGVLAPLPAASSRGWCRSPARRPSPPGRHRAGHPSGRARR